MSLLTSIILGLIQGVAEFLPISSSGHLAIAQNLLGMSTAGEIPEFFDVLLHFGTLLAVVVAYWPDVRDMVCEFFRGIGDLAHRTTPTPVPPARRLVLLVIVGTLPLFAILPFSDKIQGLASNMTFVGGALIVTGLLLFASDMVRRGRKDAHSATLVDALLIGFAQAIATAPGISRSGMTISVGCFTGFERKFAVRFSFLLSLPAVLGANILTLGKAVKAGIDWGQMPVYLVGVVTAAVVGYFCIRLLRLVAEKGKFGFFAYYCWVAGAVTLILNAIF
ncbi:MAG: undecaprenyl-diphosphate phosphatase [Clostridiales bacterium]|nr:undecaprenyl-diphosphate phosphatase [Clostridiales bacterium]